MSTLLCTSHRVLEQGGGWWLHLTYDNYLCIPRNDVSFPVILQPHRKLSSDMPSQSQTQNYSGFGLSLIADHTFSNYNLIWTVTNCPEVLD